MDYTSVGQMRQGAAPQFHLTRRHGGEAAHPAGGPCASPQSYSKDALVLSRIDFCLCGWTSPRALTPTILASRSVVGYNHTLAPV